MSGKIKFKEMIEISVEPSRYKLMPKVFEEISMAEIELRLAIQNNDHDRIDEKINVLHEAVQKLKNFEIVVSVVKG